jgi:hypothetical protein
MVKLKPLTAEEHNVYYVQTVVCGGMNGFHSEYSHFSVLSNKCIKQHIASFAVAFGIIGA